MIRYESKDNDSCRVSNRESTSATDHDLRALQLGLAKRYPSYGNTVGAVFKIFKELEMSNRQIERFCGRHVVSLRFFHKFENIATRGEVSVRDFVRKLREEDDLVPDSLREIISLMFARAISRLKKACCR